MQGSIGQTTYSAAKAGIAGMTLVAAAELGRYGVNVNAIAPVARTRMTEGAFPEMMAPRRSDDAFDAMDPANNSPVVAWLASEDCDISGRVLEIEGGQICVEEGWRHGPRQDIGRRWEAGEVGDAVRELIGQAADAGPGLRDLSSAPEADVVRSVDLAVRSDSRTASCFVRSNSAGCLRPERISRTAKRRGSRGRRPR